MAAQTTPTPHIAAIAGEIADAVLLPGDPLRARTIAETFLTDARCHDVFHDRPGVYDDLAAPGTLAVEMECAALYTCAAAHGVSAATTAGGGAP